MVIYARADVSEQPDALDLRAGGVAASAESSVTSGTTAIIAVIAMTCPPSIRLVRRWSPSCPVIDPNRGSKRWETVEQTTELSVDCL